MWLNLSKIEFLCHVWACVCGTGGEGGRRVQGDGKWWEVYGWREKRRLSWKRLLTIKIVAMRKRCIPYWPSYYASGLIPDLFETNLAHRLINLQFHNKRNIIWCFDNLTHFKLAWSICLHWPGEAVLSTFFALNWALGSLVNSWTTKVRRLFP